MDTKYVSDKVLIKQFILGNNKSFEVLLKRYQKKIFTSIILKVQDQKLAEDIFQDICIKVIKSLRTGKYNEEDKFLPWVIRISYNFIIDYFRKRESFRSSCWVKDVADKIKHISSKDNDALEQIIQDQNSRYIKSLIEKLPKKQREVVKLRHYKEYSFKEIADEMNINVNTALGRMRYAIAKLRKMLKDYNIEL